MSQDGMIAHEFTLPTCAGVRQFCEPHNRSNQIRAEVQKTMWSRCVVQDVVLLRKQFVYAH
jgi:hypothetical protein